MIKLARIPFVVAAVLLGWGCASEPSKKSLTKTERARLYVEIANGAIVEGDPTSALQTLTKAEELDSKLPELYHSKAIAYHMKKLPEKALESAKKAVSMKADYSDAWNTLGKLYLDMGSYSEAEAALSHAADDDLYPAAFKAHTNLGILYYRRADIEKAAKNFDRAIEEAPAGSCIAHYYRGHIYLQKGSFDNAAKEYDRATQKFCAGFADAHLALGIAYERNKQYDKARRKYLDIKAGFPNSKVAEEAMDHLRYLP